MNLIHITNQWLNKCFCIVRDQQSVNDLKEETLISFGSSRLYKVVKVDGVNYAFDLRLKAKCVEPLSMTVLYKPVWVKIEN